MGTGMDGDQLWLSWKQIAIAALVVALIATMALAALFVRGRPQRDDRLLGVWQSDAERMLANERELRPVDASQEAALRRVFGKLRVKYTEALCTTELDGNTESFAYEILGKDKHSVVFLAIDPKPSPLDDLFEMSGFTVIQFEGPDSYWLYS